MTEQEQAREGDKCPECGTPLEVAEVETDVEDGPRDLILRCANGHTVKVHREQ